MSERRAVITGWSVLSPIGCTRESFAEALLGGRTGAAEVRAFDASGFGSRVAAEVPGFSMAAHVGAREVGDVADRADRKAEFGLAACAGALDHAGLAEAPAGREGRWAISMGTGLASVVPREVERDMVPFVLDDGNHDLRAFARQALDDRWSASRHRTDAVNEIVAAWTGLTGPSASHFSACAAGAQAIGQALRWIRRGTADVVICGGMDSMIHPFGMASFILLGALTTGNDEPERANRPFDRERNGFLIGEGAAALIIESEEHARARGAEVHGEVRGYGTSVDAWNVTAPHPEGKGARLALERCLADARLAPEDVGYINAHGTGTELNDPIEAGAIRAALGPSGAGVPVSSTKAAHGHLIAAAGALEACVCLVALAEGALPPTLNLENPDPACDLDHVRGAARQSRIEVALSNSFGFGGQNASLAIGRPR
jgi:3-oxoacyl-[acyl-carrier-protein] synthase II